MSLDPLDLMHTAPSDRPDLPGLAVGYTLADDPFGLPVAPDSPGVQQGAGLAIRAETPRDPVCGHGGWMPGYVSSLRHCADHGVTAAFQIDTDAGILGGGSDIVPRLQAGLADLRLEAGR